MGKRVTIQDIADELGLSRNTVSKALNNAGGLSDATRERIIKKAMELGYRQFVFMASASDLGRQNLTPTTVDGPREVAVLTTMFIDRSHFASLTLDTIQNDLAQRGYVLNMHRVTKENLSERTLPLTLRLENVAALVCIEMFDHAYDDMVCSLNVPTLFLDGPTELGGYQLPSDQILMDNTTGISRLVSDMLGQGVTRIGFAGDWLHCQSFLERYLAFRNAMLMAGAEVDERFCFRCNREARIHHMLADLDELPELIICANDFVAIDALRALRKMGLDVPRDVMLSGFDDSSESRNWVPPFTTVHIHTQSIAYSAIQLLMTRLNEPDLAYRRVYTQTDLIYRRSTDRSLEA